MERPYRPLGSSPLNDEKIAIEFVDRENLICGLGALLFLPPEDGYWIRFSNRGQYVISVHLQEYLREKGIEFHLIPMPSKLRDENKKDI